MLVAFILIFHVFGYAVFVTAWPNKKVQARVLNQETCWIRILTRGNDCVYASKLGPSYHLEITLLSLINAPHLPIVKTAFEALSFHSLLKSVGVPSVTIAYFFDKIWKTKASSWIGESIWTRWVSIHRFFPVITVIFFDGN